MKAISFLVQNIVLFLIMLIFGSNAATDRTVGAGKTYATLTLANNAASAGDTISIFGRVLETAQVDLKAVVLRAGTGVLQDTIVCKYMSGSNIRMNVGNGTKIWNLVIQYYDTVVTAGTRYLVVSSGKYGHELYNCHFRKPNGSTKNTMRGLYFETTDTNKTWVETKIHRCMFDSIDINGSSNTTWYQLDKGLKIDSCWGYNSRFYIGDDNRVTYTAIFNQTGEHTICGNNDTIAFCYLNQSPTTSLYEQLTTDNGSGRRSINCYIHDLILDSANHEDFVIDRFAESKIDRVITRGKAGASIYNHNNNLVTVPAAEDTVLRRVDISHLSYLGYGTSFITTADSSTSKGSYFLRIHHSMCLPNVNSTMQYMHGDTLDSIAFIRGTPSITQNHTSVITDTITNLTTATLVDSVAFPFWRRNATRKGVWANGTYSGANKYLINKVGNVTASTGGYAVKCSLSTNFWFKPYLISTNPVTISFADSAKILVIDSSADGTSWVRACSTGTTLVPAGYSDSLRVTTSTAGLHKIKIITTTSAGTGSLKDTTELDSITISGSSVYCVLMVTAATGGTVTTPASGKDSSVCGQPVSINATALPGYRFNTWTTYSGHATFGSAPTTASNTCTITDSSNAVIVATFTRVQYTLTTATTLGGTVTPATGLVDSGAVIPISAYPSDENHSFVRWTRSGASVVIEDSSLYSTNLYLTASGTVTAYFDSTVGIPTLISPASNAIRADTFPNLKWYKEQNRDSSHYQLSTLIGFGSIVSEDTISDTTVNILALNPNTDYYWRVRGWNSSGVSDWSTVRKFTTIDTPHTPVQLKPDSSDTVSKSVQFSWSSNINDSVYILDISLVSNFASIFSRDTITDTFKSKTLTDTTTYYWRVKGGNRNSWGANSHTWFIITNASNARAMILGLGLGVGIGLAGYAFSRRRF
jgi:hypothetical protein